MFGVSIAASPALDCNDFAVDVFKHGVGDAMTAIGDDVVQVRLERVPLLAMQLLGGTEILRALNR